MATFIKCKQDIVKYKNHRREVLHTTSKRGFLWFNNRVSTCRDVKIDKEHVNTPLNLDRIIEIKKIKGLYDYNPDNEFIEGTSRPGIRFGAGTCFYRWYYDSESIRDEQFDSITSNSDSYKNRIIL